MQGERDAGVGVEKSPSTNVTSYQGPLGSYRVLVVDDEEVMRVLLNDVLSEEFSLALVESGEQALPFLSHVPPDVMVVDKNLPGMSGLELTNIIKKEYDSDVIIFTGYEKNCNHEQAIKLGASDFCYKPFRLEEMLLRVKRVLIERNKNHLDLL